MDAAPAERLPEHDFLQPQPHPDWARQHLTVIENARKEKER
ncbi:hypothetical protein [Streptomyces sp. SAJ15]|nr:hypothetical protein [Streptomyces sp. SAJ15]